MLRSYVPIHFHYLQHRSITLPNGHSGHARHRQISLVFDPVVDYPKIDEHPPILNFTTAMVEQALFLHPTCPHAE